MGDAPHEIAGGDFLALVHDVEPGHFLLLHGFHPVLRFRVERHAKDFQPGGMVFLVNLAHVGHFLPAGTAPRRPKINEFHFRLDAVQGNRGAFRRGAGKIGSHGTRFHLLEHG